MNRKAFLLPVVLLSALALSGATVPAVATETVAPVSSVETVAVTADAGAVLSVDTVVVTTEPAPVATEPTAPATVEPVATAPVAEPVATTAPATTQPVAAPVAPVTTAPATTAPVPATAPADSYVAPAPSYTCMEDQPCWDCKTMGNGICGNPACKEKNLFTVDAAGTCSTAPVNYTESDVRSEGMKMATERGQGWIMGGSNAQMTRREGYTYIESPTLPGVVHVFSGGTAADTIDCNNIQLGDAQMGIVPTCSLK